MIENYLGMYYQVGIVSVMVCITTGYSLYVIDEEFTSKKIAEKYLRGLKYD